ncbi:hypothetical protein IFR05_017220, partial [Cadophora sp. M221]
MLEDGQEYRALVEYECQTVDEHRSKSIDGRPTDRELASTVAESRSQDIFVITWAYGPTDNELELETVAIKTDEDDDGDVWDLGFVIEIEGSLEE